MISQYSSPKEMYMEPQNMFAAKFLGNPPMNFVPGEKGRRWNLSAVRLMRM